MQRKWVRMRTSVPLVGVIVSIVLVGMVVAPIGRSALANPAPTLTVHGYLAPGSTAHLEGEGFLPGETATVSYDATTIATVPVVQRLGIIGRYGGGFYTPFVVPTTTIPGSHTFTVVAHPSGLTAQIAATVNANWAQYGFTATNSRYNPYETAITSANVSKLTLAWSFTDPNSSGLFTYNTPSVAGGNIYFMTIGDNTVFANTADTGTSLWKSDVTGFPAGTGEPAVFGQSLYTTGYYLATYSTGTGMSQWMANTQYIVLDAPAYANGTVYITEGGSLEAFAAAGCGKYACPPMWTYTDGSVVGTPAVANGLVYVGTTTGKLIAVKTSTGTLAWTGSISGASGMAPGAPVVDNGTVFIALANYYSATATLYALPASCGSPTCVPLWSATYGQAYGQGPAVHLAVANGTVFVSSTDLNLYAYSESGCGSATCSPLWKAPTGGMIESAPAIANGVVYVGSDDGYIHAYKAAGCGSATCYHLWSYYLGAEAQSSPIVVNGMVYITSRSRTLYAFHLPSTISQRPVGSGSGR